MAGERSEGSLDRINLEKSVFPRKTRKARNGVSRYFAARRKLTKISNRCKAVDRYPMGERPNRCNLLVCFVPFVFFVDQSLF
jgi:hypothetical protein